MKFNQKPPSKAKTYFLKPSLMILDSSRMTFPSKYRVPSLWWSTHLKFALQKNRSRCRLKILLKQQYTCLFSGEKNRLKFAYKKKQGHGSECTNQCLHMGTHVDDVLQRMDAVLLGHGTAHSHTVHSSVFVSAFFSLLWLEHPESDPRLVQEDEFAVSNAHARRYVDQGWKQ